MLGRGYHGDHWMNELVRSPESIHERIRTNGGCRDFLIQSAKRAVSRTSSSLSGSLFLWLFVAVADPNGTLPVLSRPISEGPCLDTLSLLGSRWVTHLRSMGWRIQLARPYCEEDLCRRSANNAEDSSRHLFKSKDNLGLSFPEPTRAIGLCSSHEDRAAVTGVSLFFRL